jgi:ABC-type lipoprotein release transport system permease subunit
MCCFICYVTVMFVSNGTEISLQRARLSSSSQIQMTGSNTSGNQEINTSFRYIRVVDRAQSIKREAGLSEFDFRQRWGLVISS